MFCSHCGSQASGNFCAACGRQLPRAGSALSPDLNVPAELVFDEVAEDWSRVMQYDLLLQIPAVRRRIDAASRQSRLRISGEQFLATFDALIPTGVPLEKLAVLVQPMYSALGIRTGTDDERKFERPIGCVLVATLCALAREGCAVLSVQQAVEGCIIEAEIPSSIYAFAGRLILTVRDEAPDTWVEAAAKIPGQLYDWGRSRRLLAALFKSIELESSRPIVEPVASLPHLPPRRQTA